ncbi:MAG: hypothetical protein ACK5XN_22645, partial [Bacteroidota bacterium]
AIQLQDAYIQDRIDYINSTDALDEYAKQKQIKSLKSDPIAYARNLAPFEITETPHSEFLNSLEQVQQTEQQVPVAETQEVEVGGIVRGFESISGNNNVGDLRNKIPQSTSGIEIVEGNDGNQYAVAFSRKGADGQVIFEQGASTPRSGYISASIKIEDGATEQQIQQAKQQAADRLNAILPTVKNGKIDKAAIQQVLSKNLQDTQKQTNLAADETGKIQPERTGDGRGRTKSRKFTPLEGAPSVPGVNGPDPQLVAVAEQYAADNGIDLKRQSEYVEVDENRARRIADAYEQMADDPQNPKVKEAYQDLVNQTIAQYQALVDAGYKFWFMDLNIPSNAEYASTPYNALRDLRQNKEMGVFPTTDGYGEEGITQEQIDNNPLLQDTGIMWPVGGLDGEMMPVLAND